MAASTEIKSKPQSAGGRFRRLDGAAVRPVGVRRPDTPRGRFVRPQATTAPKPRPSAGAELVVYRPPAAQPQSTPFAERFAARVSRVVEAAQLALHRLQHRPPKTRTAKVVVVIPAHNEQDTIATTIRALLAQTRRPDRIVVVADNCTDKTVQIARSFGRRVTVIETVANKDRKVGALTMAWREYVAYGYDYLLGVDADTVLSPDSLEALERELEANPKVGGVMARYTFDASLGATRFARGLIRLQRMEFASWTLDMLHRKRNTYVLGGQATLFRVGALQEVVDGEKRLSPWDPEAQVEDMELTWALAARNWETKVSMTARAYAGPMVTLKSLWAQRRKWDEGMIRLLLGSKIGAATMYPWRMQAKMALNALTRGLFAGLLVTSLAVDAFEWNWIWIAPPIMGCLLNLKHARKVPGRTRLDLVMAGTLICVELYLWFRLMVWSTSWATVIAGIRRDGWARQYKAEGLPAGQTKIATGEVI
jgi:cellulose synthase/poly-beta-1,6-N-acetylglucosamine synthase-like glycosyltransferase